MQMRLWGRAAAALALGTAACAAADGPSPGTAPAARTAAEVRVVNNHFSDVNVFVVRSGMRWRLGTVSGLSEQRFTLPRQFAGDAAEMYLLADPIGGGRGYRSPAVRVHPGGELDLRLHSRLSMSTVSVWGP